MGWIARILAVFLALYWLGFLWPFLQSHAEQDQCSFGSVTNAAYRALLDEAKRRVARREATRLQPPDIGLMDYWAVRKEQVLESIRTIFGELAPPAASLFIRLAAMHAVVRAHDGEFRSAGANVRADEGVDPFEIELAELQRGRSAGFSYSYHIRDPWLRIPFYPLDGGSVVVGAIYYLYNKPPLGNPSHDTFDFFALLWIPWDHSPSREISNRRPNCPPVPASEWLDRYTATLKSLKE